MKSYKDLDIYKRAFDVSLKIHQMSFQLPKFEQYEVGSQIRRSSKSISSNIVEGFGRRNYKQEFIKFLIYALSSCDETRNHIEILHQTGSLKDQKLYEEIMNELEILGKMLTRFIQSVRTMHKPSRI